MTGLNKFFLGTTIILGINVSGFAGEAILFDDPGLVAYRDVDRIYGFYDAENEKFSCSFLFMQNDEKTRRPDVDGYTDTKLLTFIPSEDYFEFSRRDQSFDISGDLYRQNIEWVINTSSGQAGCENSTGGFIFKIESLKASRYHITRKIPAIGIRLVKNKSLIYDHKDGKYLVRKSYLTKRNIVVALEVRDQLSLVRFSDPRLNVKSYGRTTTGWVRSADLVDPFPLASKP